MSDTEQTATNDDPIACAQHAVQDAKARLDRLFPGPSREKALAQTKLDEALLWIGAIK